ncbi:MAG: PBECR2 nuclease fold domain-containing protein, partial [Bdellovibrionia bacterium]
RLEKEYFRRLSPSDLDTEEKEKLSHLRWMTLQEPDEVWREKTLAGDYRYTLISEFQPEDRFIWSICICLFLRGEPSFLFMAFQTKNTAMVGSYRRGERVQWEKNQNTEHTTMEENYAGQRASGVVDGLADAWTEEETQRAQVTQKRRHDDVPMSDFILYESCVDETLEAPDEVWSIKAPESNPYQVYHFMRYYAEEAPGVWYVVIARETEDAGQIEILDAFPTRDSTLVDRYRKGHQEIGRPEETVSARIVH